MIPSYQVGAAGHQQGPSPQALGHQGFTADVTLSAPHHQSAPVQQGGADLRGDGGRVTQRGGAQVQQREQNLTREQGEW